MWGRKGARRFLFDPFVLQGKVDRAKMVKLPAWWRFRATTGDSQDAGGSCPNTVEFRHQFLSFVVRFVLDLFVEAQTAVAGSLLPKVFDSTLIVADLRQEGEEKPRTFPLGRLHIIH